MAVRSIQKDEFRRSVVHIAVLDNDLEALRFLETFPKIDWDIGDYQDETPLMRCIRNNSSHEIAKFLVDKNVMIQYKDKRLEDFPLSQAARFGPKETFQLLLEKSHNVNVEWRAGGTLLSMACWIA